MLDWLKDILGDHYTDELDRRVSTEIGKGFVARTDFNDLNGRLKEAGAQIESFKALDIDGVRRAAAEWEGKYQSLQEELARKEYHHAAERAALGVRFSSDSARRAFLADLEGKKLPVREDGALLGFDEFVKDYRTRDAAAFSPDIPPPRVVASTPGSVPENTVRSQANQALRAVFGKE